MFGFSLFVKARHLVAAHTGESAPGLLLSTTQTNLIGNNPFTFGTIGPQNQTSQLIHPGAEDHYDTLLSHIDDLNGNNPGFITTPAGNQLSVRMDLSHAVPEPTTMLLFSTGILGLLGYKRFSKQFSTPS